MWQIHNFNQKSYSKIGRDGVRHCARAKGTSRKVKIRLANTAAQVIGSGMILAVIVAAGRVAAQGAPLNRLALPIPEPKYPPITTLDARNATPPPFFRVTAPKGAPNVLIILIDDMGFGQPSTFGGLIHMPTLDQLAAEGLRYNNFHTTALCSPTRAALLTGRNHHMANVGAVMDVATAFPGNTGVRPNDIAPLPQILRLNAYSTAGFGKWHLTPGWELSVSGPTDRWPIRWGFDKFYGFFGGETNQWAPLIYDAMTKVEPPHDPDYNFMTDMTNQAIAWMRAEKAMTPNKPFFVYFAPGAVHAPLDVPKKWIAKYKGMFDMGWDKLRAETLARQIKLGVVPRGTTLAFKPKAIKDWSTLTLDEKKLFARQMEVFAGYGEYADYEIGRLVQALKDLGQLNNTLVFYIAGDNGASAEGGLTGRFNELTYFNGVDESAQGQLKHYNEMGGPMTYAAYAAGWAVAGDCPFTWTKQVSSYGGTQDGMVVVWPRRIKDKHGLRSQFVDVTDIAPTVLQAAGIPQPKTVNGIPQIPMQGVSMMYTFDNPHAKSRHTTQYFEIGGNRAIYHDGWLAVAVHRAPWERTPRATLRNDKWELYNTADDFSLAHDVAAKYPQKLAQMKKLFLQLAIKNHVLPLDDRSIERMNPALAGRPDLMEGRTSLTVYPGMTGMLENAFINVKNRSHAITADVEISKQGANGVIICQGGRFGGWTLYLKDDRAVYAYNWLGLDHYTIASKERVPAGKHTIRFDFTYDGGRLGAGGVGRLFIDGKQAAEGRIAKTIPLIISPDEGADVGIDEGTPVTEDYGVGDNAFSGKIFKVTIDVKPLTPAIKRAEEKAAPQLMLDENAEE
jgi:arylsulfatase A-like enzyme